MDNLTFHLDSISTDPFQSGPTVFTLTCNSSGGPATTVQWWRSNRLLSDDSVFDMTQTLVSQSGPHYSSTLTGRGRRFGHYQCVVSNSVGNSTSDSGTIGCMFFYKYRLYKREARGHIAP